MNTDSLSSMFTSALNTAINDSSMSHKNNVLHRKSKLTYDEVIMIKLYYHLENMNASEIADKFNCSESTVFSIVKKRTHKNAPLNHMTKIPVLFHEETNNRWVGHKIKGHN